MGKLRPRKPALGPEPGVVAGGPYAPGRAPWGHSHLGRRPRGRQESCALGMPELTHSWWLRHREALATEPGEGGRWAAGGLGVALLGQRLKAPSHGSSLTSSQTEDRRKSPFPSTAEVLLRGPAGAQASLGALTCSLEPWPDSPGGAGGGGRVTSHSRAPGTGWGTEGTRRWALPLEGPV